MLKIISKIIYWLKGYRKISPPKHSPHIPYKSIDRYLK
jgi:hypothetical protein